MAHRIAAGGLFCFGLLLSLAAALPPAAPVVAPSATPAARFTPPPIAGDNPADRGVERGSRVRAAIGPMVVPIEGHGIPTESQLLPESTRGYRAGIHEGIDFALPRGTPVFAAAPGRIVRSDTAFVDWEAAERHRAIAEAVALGYTPEATLDRIRGRQVWIDHGRGIITRYAHLESVTLTAGTYVRPGDVVGTVGSSGFPDGGPHLHFEIRIGDSYLGDGLTPAELARALRAVFRD